MKQILLGGLEPTFRDKVCKAFESCEGECSLQILESIQNLEAFLALEEGDLLILDLDIANGGSLEWLALIFRLRSALPVVALGMAASPDVKGYDRQYPERYFSLIRYLQKPVDAQALMAIVMSELMQATWGVIQGLGLSTLLQMLQMERKTCTVRVTSGRRQGFFYLRNGRIINARYRRKEGLEAVLAMVWEQSPRMEIDSQLHDETQTIDLCLEEMLLQAAQVRDEGLALQVASGGDCDAVPPSEVGRWNRVATGPMPITGPEHSFAVPVQAGDLLPGHSSSPSRVGRKGSTIGAALALVAVVALVLAIPRRVELEIKSTPAGAEISLDGQRQGLTPIRLTLESPPRGTLTVSRPGYKSLEYPLVSHDRTLDFTLQELSEHAEDAARPVDGVTAKH